MSKKTEGLKAALRGLISELGGMNMDRARMKKMPHHDVEAGEPKDSEIPKKRKGGPAHMGDPSMDEP